MTKFSFRGSGLGCFWLFLWTSFLSMITLGLFFPWSYSAQQRWIAANTYLDGRRQAFVGTGVALLGHWLLILLLTILTLGLYLPWAYCRLKRWEVDNTVFADELPGTPAAPPPLPGGRVCSSCGNPVQAGWAFCPACANRL